MPIGAVIIRGMLGVFRQGGRKGWRGTMRLQKILSVEKLDHDEKGVDCTRHMTGDERVSLLEDLRRQMAKVTNHEYPRRLRRVLTIARRGKG